LSSIYEVPVDPDAENSCRLDLLCWANDVNDEPFDVVWSDNVLGVVWPDNVLGVVWPDNVLGHLRHPLDSLRQAVRMFSRHCEGGSVTGRSVSRT